MFSAEAYSLATIKMLGKISSVEADDYHGPSYLYAKKEWAMAGACVADLYISAYFIHTSYPSAHTFDPQNGVQVDDDDFEVFLD
jgi:hypothetical protein